MEFQSTRPRGARLPFLLSPRRLLFTFQSTRPRGARRRPRSESCETRSSFNPRARVGRDALASCLSRPVSCFNPRARVGRDRKAIVSLNTQAQFQSTRPRGARRSLARSWSPPVSVSIHAPAWGATLRRKIRHNRGNVSIHAPAWGATGRDGPRGLQQSVSIHAPAWGATPSAMASAPSSRFQSTRPRGARQEDAMQFPWMVYSFNPRARVGRDGTGPSDSAPALYVSIHAPAWGATVLQPTASTSRCKFQSTRPRGARLLGSGQMIIAGWFQSTRPRGARLQCTIAVYGGAIVSIHAPAWGATRCTSRTFPRRRGFNPRARVGRDSVMIVHVPTDGSFQSTRPRGARRSERGLIPRSKLVSIHAPAWGATRTRLSEVPSALSFNPRARVGRDRTAR